MAGVRITEVYDVENDSLGFMNFQSGEIGLGFMTGVFGTATFSLRLNTDSTPMTPTDGFGSYTEPSGGSGYAPITGPLFGLTLVSNAWQAEYDSAIWSLQSHTGDTVTVYGWWFQDDGGTLIAAGNLSPPFVAPLTGATLTVSPIILTLGSCTPGGPPPPPPPTVLLDDSFSGSGTVSLGSHSPLVGGPWSVTDGTVVVTGGVALATVSGVSVGIDDPGSTSYSFQTTWLYGAGDLVGYLGHYATLNDQWLTYMDGTTLTLAELVGGSSTVHSTTPLTLIPGGTYQLHGTVSGTSMVVVVGSATVSYGSFGSSLSATVIGVFWDNGSHPPTTQLQSITVTSL
jgi:hypothetical protein